MSRYRGLNVSPPIAVKAAEECTWYHCFNLPDGRYIHGRWDFVGREDELLGKLSYDGRSVLEIGPASGSLTRALERRGAEVLCVDVDLSKNWDMAPRLDRNTDEYMNARARGLQQLWKGWWYTREAFNGNAAIVYSGAGSVDRFPEPLTFDVGLVSCILQHVDNPFVILSKMARRCETIVVTDLYFPRLDLPGRALAEFIPAKKNNDLGSWWRLSPAIITQMCETLNFELVSESKFSCRRNRLRVPSREKDEFDDFRFYCNVYKRGSPDMSRYNLINEA